jgi:hypothetical protein
MVADIGATEEEAENRLGGKYAPCDAKPPVMPILALCQSEGE